jgi:hypothetical protein
MTAATPSQATNISQVEELRLAPFNPTSENVQQIALRLFDLQPSDVLLDIGAGDGRLLITAAEQCPELRCIGIELDQKFVSRAKEALARTPRQVQERVDMRQGDVFELVEISSASEAPEGTTERLGKRCQELSPLDATAIYLFLLPQGLAKIQPVLDRIVARRKALHQELRVVTNMFRIRQWKAIAVDQNTKAGSPVYLYQFKPE